MLEKPLDEARARLERAQRDVEIWKLAEEDCETAIPDLVNAVTAAQRRVARAAREIVTDTAVVERLVSGVKEMQRDLIARHVALRFVRFQGLNGELAPVDKELIESILKQDRLPTGFKPVGDSQCWEQHPVHVQWSATLEALKEDPDFELP